jgi:hypothetical protein
MNMIQTISLKPIKLRFYALALILFICLLGSLILFSKRAGAWDGTLPLCTDRDINTVISQVNSQTGIDLNQYSFLALNLNGSSTRIYINNTQNVSVAQGDVTAYKVTANGGGSRIAGDGNFFQPPEAFTGSFQGAAQCYYGAKSLTYVDGYTGQHFESDTPPETCPTGQTGTPPNCSIPQPDNCPVGQSGTPPNCVTPAPPASNDTGVITWPQKAGIALAFVITGYIVWMFRWRAND